MQVDNRTFKIERDSDAILFEVIEVVTTSRGHKVKVGCGTFPNFDAAADYIYFTFGAAETTRAGILT